MILPRLFTIPRNGLGCLATAAAPRGGEWLSDELPALAQMGVNVLVSLLTPEEELQLDLVAESQMARDCGLHFISLPTPDRGTPALSITRSVAQELVVELASSRSVVIHCRAGIGRASLLAALILVFEGVPSMDAWERISAARGLPVPDTPEQIAFVEEVLTRAI